MIALEGSRQGGTEGMRIYALGRRYPPEVMLERPQSGGADGNTCSHMPLCHMLGRHELMGNRWPMCPGDRMAERGLPFPGADLCRPRSGDPPPPHRDAREPRASAPSSLPVKASCLQAFLGSSAPPRRSKVS